MKWTRHAFLSQASWGRLHRFGRIPPPPPHHFGGGIPACGHQHSSGFVTRIWRPWVLRDEGAPSGYQIWGKVGEEKRNKKQAWAYLISFLMGYKGLLRVCFVSQSFQNFFFCPFFLKALFFWLNICLLTSPLPFQIHKYILWFLVFPQKVGNRFFW